MAHHLRLLGVPASSNPLAAAEVFVGRDVPGQPAGVPDIAARVVVLLQPATETLAALGVQVLATSEAPQRVEFPDLDGAGWSSARTLLPLVAYAPGGHDAVARILDGSPCWVRVQKGASTFVIVGTDLPGDLIRYRQGDPSRVATRQTEPMWGIPGERPFYLFEGQQPAGEFDRYADWWSMALAETVSRALGRPVPPLLPGGAPGAIVVTGDDDQAYLEKYQEQLALLGAVPITYFLHPLTRHTPQTIAEMGTGRVIEWGLHPDAIDSPTQYPEIFRTQASWFERTYGMAPTLVRNHGFLNDGYWGHLPAWLEHGVRASANIPGVNGQILNGSLLPARVAVDGGLTPHWSILTPIGDGVRFALGADGPQSAKCITDLADRIEQSRLPGVIVLNLHPQNVAETREMHEAVHALVARRFVAMTLGQCLDWFDARDRIQ